jgi:hypothetical protein
MRSVAWTDYLKYRAGLRGFDLATVESIVLFSEERYFDTLTQRMVAVGRRGSWLAMVPYEEEGEAIVPITVHSTTRQQINLRVRAGRFKL